MCTYTPLLVPVQYSLLLHSFVVMNCWLVFLFTFNFHPPAASHPSSRQYWSVHWAGYACFTIDMLQSSKAACLHCCVVSHFEPHVYYGCACLRCELCELRMVRVVYGGVGHMRSGELVVEGVCEQLVWAVEGCCLALLCWGPGSRVMAVPGSTKRLSGLLDE